MDGTEFSTAFDPIEVGNLVARLAVNDAEIGAAQALRYRVFYEEMSAHPSAEVEAAKRDFDRFDAICDHLLVIDTKRTDLSGGVVGTYRLLRSSIANLNGGFYTSDESNFTDRGCRVNLWSSSVPAWGGIRNDDTAFVAKPR